MKKVKVEESVGMVLGHDLTKITEGFKGTAFKKGHIIQAEDIEQLKNIGKEHIYLLELGAHQIHENEAAIRMAEAASGQGIRLQPPSEGKVNFIAAHDGLLKVNVDALREVNSIEEICMAMLHNNTPVLKDQIVAGTRIIPLVADKSKVEAVEAICSRDKIISVKPFKPMKVGAVITGNEVYYGRIEDRFAKVFREKMAQYGAEIVELIYAPDDAQFISNSLKQLMEKGCEAVVTSGGMSVDPDDVTPDGIRLTGAKVVSYGAPVLPGAMFMMAYCGEIPIMGIPGCGMYHKTTIFDLIFPRVLAGETISKADIAMLGHGGLCFRCKECTYPQCSFGK